jgi:hypothetical protein
LDLSPNLGLEKIQGLDLGTKFLVIVQHIFKNKSKNYGTDNGAKKAKKKGQQFQISTSKSLTSKLLSVISSTRKVQFPPT